jgi:hypothetical protein
MMKATAVGALLCGIAMGMSSPCCAEPAAPVRIFDAGELTLDRYTVLERLWTGTLRASFWIPTYRDAASAIDALTAKAGDLGADGVVDLHCVNDPGRWTGGYYCYGLAIKLR